MHLCVVHYTGIDSEDAAGESMSGAHSNSRSNGIQFLVAVLCTLLLVPGNGGTYAQSAPQDASAKRQAAGVIPNDQLDSLVASIALYPDPLLAQVLAASTYPLELVQLQQWQLKNPGLKDQALTNAHMTLEFCS